ncbi:RNA-binding domain-containing protein [Leucogyrophana mollusca]|uniref:RNA-binding domain-containing protein n=1 Tax=Leucogyrophana mollusca TaxID=85980 RepID=A0ACB8BCV7_9AGAM|nr:RNA-binding domain-containing protein [Leucogyrophana mollusca]
MARRLYLGRLPPDARSDDVAKFFDGYGRIVDCRVMTGFGFVEFENSKDAEDAVHHFNGKPFMGVNIVVEFAKESRPRRDVYESDRGFGYIPHLAARSRRPPGIRLIVSGISRDTSWQDLKDFGREAGSVSFADIDRDMPGQGVLEYLSRDDADRAVKDLDGKDLRGRPVRVAYDDVRGGPDNYRRDDRRDDRPPRDDRYRDERHYREERPAHRRERSRSPPRRAEYDDRRPRSPPPSRRDYDERKPAGYDDYRRGGYDDDRRPPDYYNDRRRDDLDRRRDERPPRREEKDDRYDDRAMRHANGDAGWAR